MSEQQRILDLERLLEAMMRERDAALEEAGEVREQLQQRLTPSQVSAQALLSAQRERDEADRRAADAIDRMSMMRREQDEREDILRRLRRRHEAIQEELRECLQELSAQRQVAEAAQALLRETQG